MAARAPTWQRAIDFLSEVPRDARWMSVGRAVLILGSVLAAAWLAYFAVMTITLPYPVEYRESASAVLTRFLMAGQNPYALENQPAAMNNNGIIYNLFVLPLALLFGNSLAVHRVVTSLFVLLSGFVVYRSARGPAGTAAWALACAVIVALALGARGHLGVFPSSTGTLFFLLGITLPSFSGFDRRGLTLSALSCLVAFFTKPYFVLSFAIVASYVFLFISKRRGVAYGLGFIALLIPAAALVRVAFPLYFVFTILSNASNTSPNGLHMLNQLRVLATEFWPSLVFMAFLLIMRRGASPTEPGALRMHVKAQVGANADLPLLPWRIEYFGYVTLCSLLAFVLLLGWHEGSFMTYSYQLIVPPFLLWLARTNKPGTRAALVGIPLLLGNMLLFSASRFPPAFLEQRDSKEWRRLYAYVDSSQKILNTPMVVPELLRLGLTPINTGKNEYFWHINPYPDIALIGPPYASIRMIQQEYGDMIAADVADAAFDRIITARKVDYFVPADLEQTYQRLDRVRITLPQSGQNYEVTIWEPIPAAAP